MPTRFTPHGAFRMQAQSRVLTSHVTGPWNAELVMDWVMQSDPWARATAADGPHGGITVIERSMLATPEALELMRGAIQFATQHLRCAGHAVVVAPGVEGRSLMAPQFEKAHQGLCPYRLFEELDEARAWMDGLIAKAQSPA